MRILNTAPPLYPKSIHVSMRRTGPRRARLLRLLARAVQLDIAVPLLVLAEARANLALGRMNIARGAAIPGHAVGPSVSFSECIH